MQMMQRIEILCLFFDRYSTQGNLSGSGKTISVVKNRAFWVTLWASDWLTVFYDESQIGHTKAIDCLPLLVTTIGDAQSAVK